MSNSSKPTAADIDALLPQTQCQLCEYDGCMPYAKAIAEDGETIDRCLPGGLTTLASLGQLMDVDTTPMIEALQQKYKPPSTVVIREEECIGCTKCIQACPVDAIVGTGKLMHTVITDHCTGCELCIPPCPVDCIDIIPSDTLPDANISRQRHQLRDARLQRNKQEKQAKQMHAKSLNTNDPGKLKAARRAAVAAAVARVNMKKVANNEPKNS